MTALVLGLAVAVFTCSIFALVHAVHARHAAGVHSASGARSGSSYCWRHDPSVHNNRADPRCFAGGCTECCGRFCRDAHGTSCGESLNAAAMGAARVAESIKRLRTLGWLCDDGEHWRLSKQATSYAEGIAVVYALSSEAEKQST